MVYISERIKIVPDYAKCATIGVDSYVDKRLMGTAFFPSLETKREFSNLIQLLIMFEESMDALNYPDEYTAIKSFSENLKKKTPQFEGSMRSNTDFAGVLATFKVKVVFRQNASWQGIITWIEGRQEQTFRSVYELIRLMDNALDMRLNEDCKVEDVNN